MCFFLLRWNTACKKKGRPDSRVCAGFVPQNKGTQPSECCTAMVIPRLTLRSRRVPRVLSCHICTRWKRGSHATTASSPPPRISYARKCYRNQNEETRLSHMWDRVTLKRIFSRKWLVWLKFSSWKDGSSPDNLDLEVGGPWGNKVALQGEKRV